MSRAPSEVTASVGMPEVELTWKRRELEGWLHAVVADRDGFLDELRRAGKGTPGTPRERARWSWLLWTRRALELELEVLDMLDQARVAEQRLAESPLVLSLRVLRGRQCELAAWPERVERKREQLVEAQLKCQELATALLALSYGEVARA